MATEAHPSYGHLSQQEWEAAKNAPFGGASDFKRKASRRRAAAKAAATRAAKAAATRAAKKAQGV